MIVLVCGGRKYRDFETIATILDDKREDIQALVHGDADGADRLGGLWARTRGVPEIKIPAQWKFYGNSAGPLRNGWMLNFIPVDLVIAFPGGSGTANMVEQATEAGITVYQVRSSVV